MKSIHVGSLSGRLLILLLALSACPLGADETFPPGWLPVSSLDDKPSWSDVRDIRDRIHLYLPGSDQPVRGVFACFVFHSGDPRELADLSPCSILWDSTRLFDCRSNVPRRLKCPKSSVLIKLSDNCEPDDSTITFENSAGHLPADRGSGKIPGRANSHQQLFTQ